MVKFNHALSKQKYKCKICKNKLNKSCVDHDHITNNVRGILCPRCNLMIGQAEDSIKILTSAIKYLKHNKIPTNIIQFPSKKYVVSIPKKRVCCSN